MTVKESKDFLMDIFRCENKDKSTFDTLKAKLIIEAKNRGRMTLKIPSINIDKLISMAVDFLIGLPSEPSSLVLSVKLHKKKVLKIDPIITYTMKEAPLVLTIEEVKALLGDLSDDHISALILAKELPTFEIIEGETRIVRNTFIRYCQSVLYKSIKPKDLTRENKESLWKDL